MISSSQAALLGISKAPKTWDLTVTTTDVSQDYTVEIDTGSSPNINIDWGDGGAVEKFTSTGEKNHTYSAAGTYTVKISGSFAAGGNIRLGSNVGNRARLKATKAVCYIPGLVNFWYTFYNCTGMACEIPVDLFRYNTLVSSNGFNGTFYECTGLTGSIPADLFRYNTLVGSAGFTSTFKNCTGLTGSIPTDLFKYNTACTGFYRTFYACNKLELSAYIFFAAGEEGTRFLNQSVNFTECFRIIAAYTGAQGTAPALWNCDFGTGTPTTTDCFQGHDSSSLSNWASIPAAWT